MQRDSCDQTGRKAIPFATPCRFCGQNLDIPNDTIKADYAIRQHFQCEDLDRSIEQHLDIAQLQRESEYKERLSKLFELSQKFGIAQVCGSVDTTPTAAANSRLISSRSSLSLEILEEASHGCKPTAETKQLSESQASAQAQTQHQPQEAPKTSPVKALRYQCDFCDKTFDFYYMKKQHTRVHTGEKPFKCTVCDRCFSTNGALQRHQREVHKKEKPFLCDKCGKHFSEKSNLYVHQRVVHQKAKPFHCVDCGKCFSQNVYLKKHKHMHTGERPFCCDICGKLFTWQSALKTHKISLHTDEYPYRCPNCNRGFFTPLKKNKHQEKCG